MPREIDEVDKVILDMLQEDARKSFREIAERANVSEATIFVRVRKLLERGIIKRFSALVSSEQIGRGLTAFVLIDADPKRLQDVYEALSVVDDIYEIYDVTGSYYAIVKIRTTGREKLKDIIDRIGLIEGITRTETAIVFRCIKEETKIKV
ncbi:MAG: Lrp/AsnC family transcriptional regulator [Candidatus Bathyarchaeota archaeon]|nr:Lrp/AsnC family transcriptional regulator [Candidatus Bathyarchaeota archaeon]